MFAGPGHAHLAAVGAGLDNTAYQADTKDPGHQAGAGRQEVAGGGTKAASVLASLRSVMVVIALSVHSLFEGMAIGLEESNSGTIKMPTKFRGKQPRRKSGNEDLCGQAVAGAFSKYC